MCSLVLEKRVLKCGCVGHDDVLWGEVALTSVRDSL